MSEMILKHKRSNTVINGNPLAPSADKLAYGEIAINYADGHEAIFLKNDKDEVVEFSTKINDAYIVSAKTYASNAKKSADNAAASATAAANSLAQFTPYVTYAEGVNTASSITSVPITKRTCFCTISASASFALSSTSLAAGREIHCLIYNSGSAAITVSIPNSGSYVNLGDDAVTVGAKETIEINALSANSKIYLRNS